MYLTLGQAAKETGKSKSVISNAIKSGRMSAVRGDTGSWQIDPAELFRVFPAQNTQNGQKERDSTQENTLQNRLLEQEVKFLREQLEDLRADRDHWRQQATRLLADGRPANSTQKPRGSFWQRLVGKTTGTP
jgi:hypothetical protein